MSTAIRVESVSKLYRLGEIGTGSLAHDVNRWWHRIRGKEDPYAKIGQVNDRTKRAKSEEHGAESDVADGSLRSPLSARRSSPDYVWALKDIDFEIEQGEVVGIIGRNGAGKSTLLKILSRVTSPTRGVVRARGRIASLLEVGTGFHPELTGRENIYLNGAILGMRKHEITCKLEEIVEFSGCERYIDTPVKRYSSGMHVRLAFAVAAHLDPEIMIIDEVLAVGDGDFQKKCLGKMRSMHDQGSTVLIVSHQMSMITSLCDRGIVMQNGRITFSGSSSRAVLHYQPSNNLSSNALFDAELLGKTIGDERIRFKKAWTEDSSGNLQQVFDIGQTVVIAMEYAILKPSAKYSYPNFHVFDQRGEYVFVVTANNKEFGQLTNQTGDFTAKCMVPGNLLNTGTYYITIAATAMDPQIKIAFWERDALAIEITEDMATTLDGQRNGYAGVMPGAVRPLLHWEITRQSN